MDSWNDMFQIDVTTMKQKKRLNRCYNHEREEKVDPRLP
jgi:hypothetical protein